MFSEAFGACNSYSGEPTFSSVRVCLDDVKLCSPIASVPAQAEIECKKGLSFANHSTSFKIVQNRSTSFNMFHQFHQVVCVNIVIEPNVHV